MRAVPIPYPDMRKGVFRSLVKLLELLAPGAGFEPATNRLTAGCSTTELPGNKAAHIAPRLITKPSCFAKAETPLCIPVPNRHRSNEECGKARSKTGGEW